LISSFPIWIPLISSFCLITLSKNSNTILNNIGMSRHPYLIPDFRRNCFSFCTFSILLAISLLCWSTFLLLLVSSEIYHESLFNFLKRLLICCISSSVMRTSNTIMFFWFLTYPHTSRVCSHLVIWPKSNHITVFALDLKSTYEGEHTIFGLLSLDNLAQDDLLQFHPFTCKW
jgi:hypothetical protein